MKESFDALIDYLMDAGLFLEQAVEILEKKMIERALQSTAANQSEASKMLGIHRNTLQRKMVAYQIDGRRPRRRPVGRAQGKAARRAREAS
jgi:DNA-binding NtrC family response regulator